MRALLLMAGLAFALAMLVLALRGCDEDPATASTANAEQQDSEAAQARRAEEDNLSETSEHPSRPESTDSPAEEAESAGGAPDSAAGPSSGGAPSEPAPDSPEAALSSAHDLRSSADAKAAEGNDQGAFEDASRAYGLVRQFPDHDGCRNLAAELLRDLETLEERADSGGTAPPDATKRLILK